MAVPACAALCVLLRMVRPVCGCEAHVLKAPEAMLSAHVGPQGLEQVYAVVPPYGVHGQATFAGHLWVVRTANNSSRGGASSGAASVAAAVYAAPSGGVTGRIVFDAADSGLDARAATAGRGRQHCASGRGGKQGEHRLNVAKAASQQEQRGGTTLPYALRSAVEGLRVGGSGSAVRQISTAMRVGGGVGKPRRGKPG